VSRVYFISDLHLGHTNILKFSGALRDGDTVEEHDQILITKWNSTVRKRDLVYVLGDVCMHKSLDILGELQGRKVLIRGNHDTHSTEEYLKYFEEVYGIVKYKRFWLSHAPVHPDELRGCKNIHGHVHSSSIKIVQEHNGFSYPEYDKRYINVCCEVNNSNPIPFEDIRDGAYWDYKRT